MTAIRCPECNYKTPTHSPHCRAGIDESKPMAETSAARYKNYEVGTGDVCGPAAPPRPAGERYFSLDNPIADEAFSASPVDGYPPHNPLGPERAAVLPDSALARKNLPLASGLLDYFPAALTAVAALSQIGNEQHNPGQPMHWNRAKSGDEADALMRHLIDRGAVDTDGVRHSVKVAWRAMALLQKELEDAGLAPLARGAR